MESFEDFADSKYLRKTIYNADMYAWSDTLRAVGDEAKIPARRHVPTKTAVANA